MCHLYTHKPKHTHTHTENITRWILLSHTAERQPSSQQGHKRASAVTALVVYETVKLQTWPFVAIPYYALYIASLWSSCFLVFFCLLHYPPFSSLLPRCLNRAVMNLFIDSGVHIAMRRWIKVIHPTPRFSPMCIVWAENISDWFCVPKKM